MKERGSRLDIMRQITWFVYHNKTMVEISRIEMFIKLRRSFSIKQKMHKIKYLHKIEYLDSRNIVLD